MRPLEFISECTFLRPRYPTAGYRPVTCNGNIFLASDLLWRISISALCLLISVCSVCWSVLAVDQCCLLFSTLCLLISVLCLLISALCWSVLSVVQYSLSVDQCALSVDQCSLLISALCLLISALCWSVCSVCWSVLSVDQCSVFDIGVRGRFPKRVKRCHLRDQMMTYTYCRRLQVCSTSAAAIKRRRTSTETTRLIMDGEKGGRG